MTLAHDVEGTGPVVVLLHAGVCDRRMWDAQWVPLLDAGFRLVRCDFRGFGDTPAPTGPHNDADDVLALLAELGIEQAALVGASYGGRVAIELAARRPNLVRAMALLCAGLAGQDRSPELRAFGEREDALLEAGDIAGATALNVETWLGPAADAATHEAVRRMQQHAFELQLPAAETWAPIAVDFELSAASARCLSVSGAHDLPDFRRIAATLPDLLPNARHLELPWAGHLPSLERPATVTDLLVDLLREI